MMGLQLIFANHSKSAGTGWIITAIMMPVKVVVHNHHGMPIITERTPPDIIVPPAPVDPSWAPDSRGYPVPA